MSGPAFIEHFSYIGLFVLLILGAIGLPFPEGTTLIVCGVLIFTHVIKSIPALLIASSGILIVAGVIRMPVHKLLIADAIASLFAIAIWTGIGYIGGNSLEIIKEDISRVEHIGILFVIIVISIYLLFRYFKSRRDRTTL